MARLRICDNRPVLWQWDTGIEVELCECDAEEIHFETEQGVVKRTLNNGICTIPDVCLQRAGCLICYAFVTGENQRYTKHEFRLLILDRPKPADYIDPASEETAIESIVTRLKSDNEFITLTKGAKGDTPVKGKDYWTTEDKNEIISAVDAVPKLVCYADTTFDEGTDDTFMVECADYDCIGWVVLCELPVDSQKSSLVFTVTDKDGMMLASFSAVNAYHYAYQRDCAFVCTNTSGIWRTEFLSQDAAQLLTTSSKNINDFIPEPYSAQDFPTCNAITINIADGYPTFPEGTTFKFYVLHR